MGQRFFVGNYDLNVVEVKTQYKVKRARIGFVLLALLSVSVLIGVSVYTQVQTNNVASLVSFTCRPLSGNLTFVVSVAVDLKDGLDEMEAVRVASEVYNVYDKSHISHTARLRYFTSRTCMQETGIWTVEFNAVYSRDYYCSRFLYTANSYERFSVKIDLNELAVIYNAGSLV